jgi:DNA recombination protein RmuC
MLYVLFFVLGLGVGGLFVGLWHRAQLKLLEQARGSMKHEFAQLAQDILDEKGKKFAEQNHSNLSHLINPLRDQIKTFEQKIQETYDKETRDRVMLSHEIKNLKELNQQISQDALNLTNALKGDRKAQGTWGEVILERVLQLSGLEKGREYETQASLKNEINKTFQPDVIVHLPDNKDIIIDSKVSLIAYERYQSAEEADKALQLNAHLQSLRTHIKSLSDKEYQKLKGIQTLDFVLMFVPIEPALTLAMQADETLFNEALSRNIVLVTPSTLLATLRTIQNIWRFEYQNQNALKIAQKAGDLYDKFVSFTEDMLDLGKRLDTTQKSYEAAMNKLKDGRGNIIKRTEELRTMGAQTSKKLCDTLALEADPLEDDEDKESPCTLIK